jgi:hypothetical protein
MDRITHVDRIADHRDDAMKAERLRHRRAAAKRCERAGLLRRCAPVAPDAGTRCCAA